MFVLHRVLRSPLLQSRCQNLSTHAEELLISASRGQPLVGATSQHDLVQRMVKASILTHPTAVEAMSSISRSHFINGAKQTHLLLGGNEEERDADPYANQPQPLGHGGANLSTPQFHGEVLQALADSLRVGSTALDIGTGTGYLASVFALMVGSKGGVTAVDCIEPLIKQAEQVTQQVLSGPKAAAQITFCVAADWHEKEDHVPKYNTIYCAPAVSSSAQVINLSRLLHLGGTMVVPLAHGLTGEQRLLKVIKKGDEAGNIEQEDIGPVACQPVLVGNALLHARQPPPAPKPTRSEELKQVQLELAEWTTVFADKNGRRPNREELNNDPVGGALFARFTAASKIGSIE